MSLCLLTLMIVSCGRRVAIGDLRCEYLVAPLGIDTRSPRFTWTYVGEEEFVPSVCRLLWLRSRKTR